MSLALAICSIVLLASPKLLGSPPGEAPRLLDAIEQGELVLVGKLGSESELDVERALVGNRARGDRIALDESHGLGRGERVLVALISSANETYRVDAFLRRPAQDSLRTLQRYLALEPGVRRAARGIGELIRMADDPSEELALGAVARLADIPDLGTQLAPIAAMQLLAPLDRRREPRLREAVLELIEARKLHAVAEWLRALIEGSEPAKPVYYEALGRLEGGLSGPMLDELLENEHPDYRALGARFASGPALDEMLPKLALHDPFPQVRAAAVLRLGAQRGARARDTFDAALRDKNLEVRAAAERAVAALAN